MNHTRMEILPGVVLDARRALWLENEGVLAVADLHVGYAWTHRARGQILPVSAPESAASRLLAMVEEYRPRTVALLGDIVHGVVPVEEWREAILGLLRTLRERAEVVLVAGNHDRHLASIVGASLPRLWRTGPHLLLHGDGEDALRIDAQFAMVKESGGLLISGHEHPGIVVSDRVAHSAKVPCFLIGEHGLVLPAFSDWAAGGNVRGGEYFSLYARASAPRQAVAILAGKLLAMPIGG
jgi:putative SbcD/Mre11-related phosphoesterase